MVLLRLKVANKSLCFASQRSVGPEDAYEIIITYCGNLPLQDSVNCLQPSVLPVLPMLSKYSPGAWSCASGLSNAPHHKSPLSCCCQSCSQTCRWSPALVEDTLRCFSGSEHSNPPPPPEEISTDSFPSLLTKRPSVS